MTVENEMPVADLEYEMLNKIKELEKDLGDKYYLVAYQKDEE